MDPYRQALYAGHDAIDPASDIQMRLIGLKMNIAGIQIYRSREQVVHQANDRRFRGEIFQLLIIFKSRYEYFIFRG